MLPKSATWLLGATASALFLVSGLAGAQGQAPETRIGIFFPKTNSIPLGRALAVRYERYVMPLAGATARPLERIREAEAAGFRLNIQFTNVVASETAYPKPGPVTDDNAFEAELSAALDATHPELVTIQNEEDGLQFWSGTPADYLHELSDSVQVAHAKGYKISNGGLTMTGVKLAYWHHLWIDGQHEAADRFAREDLTAELNNGQVILGDIPDSANPGRPVLSQNQLMRAKLARVETLLAGYPRVGVDYVNFHWYESGPEDLKQVATWLSQTTRLPVICNEMGEFSASPDTITALLSEAVALHLAYVFWFAPDGPGAAVGLADNNGATRVNAAAFRAFVIAHR